MLVVTIMDDQIRHWVRQQMAARKITQEDLAELLGLSQAAISARLSGKPGTPSFKLPEVERLERRFGEPSPLRFGEKPQPLQAGIPPHVVRAVVRHIANEYPEIISNPDVSEVILDLCEYVMDTNAGGVSRAVSALALKRVRGIVGG